MLRRLALLACLVAGPAAAADDLVGGGASLYKQICAHCHGIDMVNPGTSSFDLRTFPQDERARFFESVTKGRNSMPAMGDLLREGELEALWAYVATRGGKEPLLDEGASAAPPERPGGSGALTACLPIDGGIMAGRRVSGGTGFDYAVAGAVAEHLGRQLEPVWFEAELEEESSPLRDTYALLSGGYCDVVPGHMLYAGALGPPPAARARAPRLGSDPRGFVPDFIDLVSIAASAPYARMEIGIVTAAPSRMTSLDDLAGLKVGIEQGTLAGALTTMQAPPEVVAGAVMLPPGPEFLWAMENGAFEAALVATAAYDTHRRQNLITGLILSEWRHPMGFNIGFALRDADEDLRAAVDAAVAELRAEGRIEAIGEETGTHFAAPRLPDIHPQMTLADLRSP